jgi:anaerobic C4-dicarboxylate transporter DcuA
MIGILFVWKRGKELSEDPEFQERMKDPTFAANLEGTGKKEEFVLAPGAIKSVIIFGFAVVAVVVLGSFPAIVTRVWRQAWVFPGLCGE